MTYSRTITISSACAKGAASGTACWATWAAAQTAIRRLRATHARDGAEEVVSVDKEDWAKGATAIMVVTVPVVALSLSIAAGIAFGAAWGFASFAVMVAACAAIVVWAAKKG